MTWRFICHWICLCVCVYIHTSDGHCMTIRHWVSANASAPWTIWENHISLPVRNVLTSWCVNRILSSRDHYKLHRLTVLIDIRRLLSQLEKFNDIFRVKINHPWTFKYPPSSSARCRKILRVVFILIQHHHLEELFYWHLWVILFEFPPHFSSSHSTLR